jgi:hypothetical protein
MNEIKCQLFNNIKETSTNLSMELNVEFIPKKSLLSSLIKPKLIHKVLTKEEILMNEMLTYKQLPILEIDANPLEW